MGFENIAETETKKNHRKFALVPLEKQEMRVVAKFVGSWGTAVVTGNDYSHQPCIVNADSPLCTSRGQAGNLFFFFKKSFIKICNCNDCCKGRD